MADSIDRVFAHALQTVRKIPRSGSARPPAADRLKLYGLYKQSMEGDVEGVMERPSLLPPEEEGDLTREERAEVEKWDAWSSCAGLSRSEAKCKYIDALISTMHTYAYGTPEARELVNELEFVWDQVKSNAAFSSNSNGSGEATAADSTKPLLAGTSRRHHQQGIDEILTSSSQHRTGRTKEGLRVLRPMSDQDEDDEYQHQQQKDSPNDPNEDHPTATTAPAPIPSSTARPWQTRVDRALVQMTAEIAALREVVEARGLRVWGQHLRGSGAGSWPGSGGMGRGWIAWLIGRIWALAKRALIDAFAVAALYLAWRVRVRGLGEIWRLLRMARDLWRRRVLRVWREAVAASAG